MTAELKPRGEPSNAQSVRWFATIDGYPDIDFKLVDFTLPMISIGETDLGGPTASRFVVPGDRVNHDEIQLNFLVDKSYKNYIQMFQWIKSNATMTAHQGRDVTVFLLDNQGQDQGVSITYVAAWPMMLAPISLDSVGATNDVQAAITMRYDDVVFN